ncbi:hypothetical protein [Labrenzia sp. DG1229]|uniref:hypothetical protein n=1 Tax=Labrenzia sp. DG1229 TaxID=681847 RepID=UPI000490DDDB|nr:hypothetical protein [Labrenzia sp. DG1229]
MLSSDLQMLARQFDRLKNDQGEIHMTAHITGLVELILIDAIDVARHMEAIRVQRNVRLLDLSDPKIAMLPVRRRVAITTPDDGSAA